MYIDHSTLDFNKQIGNATVNYFHNDKGNSITNVTIISFKTVTKILMYLKVKLAEDENDWECKREFVRTVVDVEKAVKGAQANFLIAAFMENLQRFTDFEVKLPFQPVNYVSNNLSQFKMQLSKGNVQVCQLYFRSRLHTIASRHSRIA